MKRTRWALGLGLAVGLTTACGSDDGSDGSGGAGGTGGSSTGGSNTGGSNTGGSGTGGTSGSAGTAGTGQGGKGGSGGTAGSGGATGGSGGSAGSAGSAGTGGTGDGVSCTESGVGCLCSSLPPQPDDIPECSAQSVNGICCQNSATDICSCRSWSCENDSLGCSCGAGVEDGPLKACTGSYGVCCLSQIGTASSCYCDDILTECDGDDVEVENCEVAIAPCGPGEEPVDACKQ